MSYVENITVKNYNQMHVLETAAVKWICDKISQDRWPTLGNNTIYQLNNNISDIGLCNLNETEFQKMYNTDIGTTINSSPNNTEIISQARMMLFGWLYILNK